MDIKFQWTEDMSVNHNILDKQHKQLFEKINSLLDAIVDKTADNVVIDLIDFFEKYMNGHLVYEEQYLKDIGYPQTQEHHKQHQVFVDKYKELKVVCSEADADKHKLVFEIENFMGSWLTNHILIEDQKYAKYIKNMNK
ncbi:MAG: bacteriohemerythrin [Candidatus Moraniibacteriota bacterium]|jgi:hemerythrin-like metal-binding protein